MLIRNRRKDMKKVIIGIVVVVLIAIAILGNIDLKKEDDDLENSKVSDALKFKNEYEKYNNVINENNQKKYPSVSIDKNNPIKYSNVDEIVDVIENKTGIIYFGYPECPWCRNAVPVLLNAAISSGVGQIYYLNTKDIRNEMQINDDGKIEEVKAGKDGYDKLLEAMDSILEEYMLLDQDGNEVSTGTKRLYVPLVVFVKDGEIVGHHLDVVESLEDPYTNLTGEQTEELYNIYLDNILKVTDTACDESC